MNWIEYTDEVARSLTESSPMGLGETQYLVMIDGVPYVSRFFRSPQLDTEGNQITGWFQVSFERDGRRLDYKPVSHYTPIQLPVTLTPDEGMTLHNGVMCRFRILRNVENGSKTRIPVGERPSQVWTLLNEDRFRTMGLHHHVTGFIEDYLHDWDWKDGQFRFYGHSGGRGERHDLVLLYEGGQ